MGLPILIMGKSGSGKTASLRDFEKVLVVNVLKKAPPFRKPEGMILYPTKDYNAIKQTLLVAKEKGYSSVVIDDAGYLMTDAFMKGHSAGKGNAIFELYNSLADNFYDLIRFVVDALPDDVIVYFMMHEDKNDTGDVKPKTIGKMLDDKVCLEGMFTIVLRALKMDGKYVFATNSDGLDVTKSPMGLFENEYIENDLQAVDKIVREYYKKEA